MIRWNIVIEKALAFVVGTLVLAIMYSIIFLIASYVRDCP